jgi:hypothetical protein
VFDFKFLFILCKTLANAKDLQKLGTLEIRIIKKKKEMYFPCIQSNYEVGKTERKNHNDTIFATVFPSKILLSTHTQKATHDLSIFVCCIIVNKNILKTTICIELW